MLFDYIPLLLATVAGTGVGATAACRQDNCLRGIESYCAIDLKSNFFLAVIVSAVPTRSESADCASYFRTTFTPPTVTMSVTKTKVIKTTISETVLISTTDM